MSHPAVQPESTPVAALAGEWRQRLKLDVYTAIDLETTGLDSRTDSIIEIGAVRFRNGKPEAEFQTFLKCERPLDPFITELTGIRDGDLTGAPAFADIAESLAEFLGDSVLVGQNVDFDIAFLSAAGLALRPADHFGFRVARVLDTAMLARIFWPELPRFSLARLADAFEVELAQAHRAAEDARATGNILAKMLSRLPSRVWGRLANSLHLLIAGTTHRSRFFFDALAEITSQIDKPPPLEFAEKRASEWPDRLNSLETWLGEETIFCDARPGFSHRPMQLSMANEVSAAFSSNLISMIEAPTGTGKSLAYLLPSLIWAQQNSEDSRQVFISSHTRALQEQLVSKEISDIESASGIPARAAVLKGRRNYLCKRRLRLLLKDADSRLSELERIKLMPLLRWAELTATGDISEIGGFNETAESYLWSLVVSDAQACAGSACGSAKGDFHRAALEKAARSHLIFINHALLMSDPNRFLQSPAPNRKIIIDEAHALERAAVAAMTVELYAARARDALNRLVDDKASRGILLRVLRSANDLSSELEQQIHALMSAAELLHNIVRQSFGQMAASILSLSTSPSQSLKIRFHRGDRIHRIVAEELRGIAVPAGELSSASESLVTKISDRRGESKLSPDVLFELRSAAEAVTTLKSQIDLLLDATEENRVFWVEAGKGRSVWCSLFAAPVSVGEMLSAELWPKLDTAILTSATLTADGSFHHLRDSLGLDSYPPERRTELALESPFDLPAQMRVFVPQFLPDPRDQGAHLQSVAELCVDLSRRVRRGTLVLCTSLEAVRTISTALDSAMRSAGRVLLTQRTAGSTHELVRCFRNERDAVLVGAASFWEGIDVIGEALQILVIVKLPFDVPTDPWVEARSEHLRSRGGDAFNEFSLPEATLKLKQGLGRLIRHHDDRGIAILCDPRITKSRFGRRIQQSLPVEVEALNTTDELYENTTSFFHSILA